MQKVVVSQNDLVTILERSLYEFYLVDAKKFDVKELINQKKVHQDLLNKLENVIQKKCTQQHRRLEKIAIDFGKYPLVSTWTLKEPIEEQVAESERNSLMQEQHRKRIQKAVAFNQK